MKAAVITTINRLHDTFINKFIDCDYNCIVVGDLKTPDSSYTNQNNINYVPHECKLFPEISKQLPLNHYSRKNLGYLHAIKQNASVILDTDDDNFPVGDILAWNELDLKRVSGCNTPNILTLFTDNHIWSRGYPLELVNQNQLISTSNVNQNSTEKVGIVQSLVDGDPDVDAIYRLTSKCYNSAFEFKKGIGFIFNKNIFSQGNTQSTLWVKPSLFHLLYIPTTVSFRFCDILKLYVAQRCMWEYDFEFAVTSPFFNQTRNYHDYMEDFKSETSMYRCLYDLLINILPSIKLKGDPEDIIRVYEVLEKKQITKSREMDIIRSFINYCR